MHISNYPTWGSRSSLQNTLTRLWYIWKSRNGSRFQQKTVEFQPEAIQPWLMYMEQTPYFKMMNRCQNKWNDLIMMREQVETVKVEPMKSRLPFRSPSLQPDDNISASKSAGLGVSTSSIETPKLEGKKSPMSWQRLAGRIARLLQLQDISYMSDSKLPENGTNNSRLQAQRLY